MPLAALVFIPAASAGQVRVDHYYSGLRHGYVTYSADNYVEVSATFDDSMVTGAANEYIDLESITIKIVGPDAWGAGTWSWTNPVNFKAWYQYGSYWDLSGEDLITHFGVRFSGTFGHEFHVTTRYHGFHGYGLASQTGPTPVAAVADSTGPGILLLTLAGLAAFTRRRD